MPAAKKTISKQNTGLFPEYLDFKRLREEGLRHIQTFSSDLWTDHNLHDPGITILEALCYALLDLGYRTNLPLADLLAADPKQPDNEQTQFFTAAEILSNNPLTELDFRKLLLDLDGVRNAWLLKADQAEVDLYLKCQAGETENQLRFDPAEHRVVLNGLYRVLLELEPVRPVAGTGSCGQDDGSTGRILDEARARLHAHRNLGEDFLDITVLHDEQIGVCAHLEIEPEFDPEDVLVVMFERLREFLSPSVRFYSLQELLAKGRSIEDIYEGRPLLRTGSHGFLDPEELDQLTLPEELHTSDLYRVVLGVPGIRAVTRMSLFNYIGGQPQTTGAEWRLRLTPGYHPVLAPEHCKITFFKDGVPFGTDLQEAADRYTERLSNAGKSLRPESELDRAAPQGIHRPIGEYYSIQHDFPLVYGIGEGGLPTTAPLPRQAQALQLKGYLLFFDQILANYLAQLAHLRDFFALAPAGGKADRPTYYAGGVDSVPDLAKLIRGAAAFDPEGEAITGSNIRYRVGEVAVTPFDVDRKTPYEQYLFFKTPLERDDVVRRVLAAFENEEWRIEPVEEICGSSERYRFLIHLLVNVTGGRSELILRSAAAFRSPEEARREAEALTFLGLDSNHFRLIDRQVEAEYSFDIAYQPRPYADILRNLAETPDHAIRRRDRFLNHLLARFAEDFSDYALLQYTLDGQRSDYAELVGTKEQFLADYPDLSRNRGRGFDYTDTNRLWNTDNVTGLEKRVSRLMGIGDWTRRTLSPFEVTAKNVPPTFHLLDFRGRTLLESAQEFADFDTFRDKIRPLAANPANYRPIGCAAQSVYGFQVVEYPGTADEYVMATHPDTYSTAEIRDAKMHYVARLFAGTACLGEPDEKVAGWFLNIEASDAGHYFVLDTKDGATAIHVESAHAYPDPKNALAAWVHFLDQARDKNNYILFKEPYGPRYVPQVLGTDGQPLALLSKTPLPLAEAQTVLDETALFFGEYEPSAVLLQQPSAWTWRLTDSKGNTLLESLYEFGSREQAAYALYHALERATQADHFERNDDTSGAFAFFLLDQYPAGDDHPAYAVRIAAPPHTWTGPQAAAQRDAALDLVVCTAEMEFAFEGNIEPNANTVRLLVCDDTGRLLLRGLELFTGYTAAQAGWQALLPLLKNGDAFHYDYENGIFIRLTDALGRVLAEVPERFFDGTTAEAYIADLAEKANSGHLRPDTVPLKKMAFAFRLTDCDHHPLLLGNNWYADRPAALAAYLEALESARHSDRLRADDGAEAGIFSIQLVDEKGVEIARSIEKFKDAAARDVALTEWRAWFAGSSLATQVLECPGDWYYHILDEGAVALASATTYPTRPDAALALALALEAAVEMSNYRCFAPTGGCNCTFELHEKPGGPLWAAHPTVEFPDKAACEAAVAALVEHLKSKHLPYKIEERTDRWHYELWWESCDEQIEPVLLGQERYPDCAAAKAAFLKMVDWVFVQKPTLLEPTPGHFNFIFVEGKTKDSAVHPRIYGSKEKAERVVAELKKYVAKQHWLDPNDQTEADAGFAFRLRKDDAALAQFNTFYSDVAERDAALSKMLKTVGCVQPQFSVIDLGAAAIFEEKQKFHFQISSGSTRWWRSAQAFDTREDALKALEEQYFTIIALAAVAENYRTDCEGSAACYFWLPDPDKPEQPLVRTDDFTTKTNLLSAFEARLRHARLYPVFPLPDVVNIPMQYGFRLTDPVAHRPIWISTRRYEDTAAAWSAFEQFIALLPFRDSYFPLDIPELPCYVITVEAAGLVGRIDKKEVRGVSGNLEIIPFDEAETWAALDECLYQFGTETLLLPYFDLHRGCRHGLRFAGAAFQLARPPQVWHHPSHREAERDRLFQQIQCSGILDKKCGDNWFFIDKEKDCGRTWTYLRKQLDPSWMGSTDQPIHSSLKPILLWRLDCGVLEYREPTSDNPCANNNPARIEVETIIDLMALARAKDCYVEVQDPGPDAGPLALGLLDRQNRLAAVGTGSAEDPAGWQVLRDAAIAQAEAFPFVRKGDGFGFQLMLGGKVVLESIQTYSNVLDVSQAWCKLLEVLQQKSNYAAVEPGDCGPFGIEIIDFEHLKATHPTTYAHRNDATAAINDLTNCMDAEGFHALEHILLRPKVRADTALLPACADCGDEDSDYLPGADPYSFWVTVAIPHWGRRFRNLDFRQFLEKTLRREAPAHVGLRIGWISPKQMRELEIQYRAWLTANAFGDESCGRQKALNALIPVFRDLENRYPAASLHDCDTPDDSGAGYVLLDKTLLAE